ncbi:hypothetical protein MNB_SV-13-205 [hydrothermal vent metagenome]|uniref:Cadherin domain-containing protein n=1 Tax=hydrothermal vent metagenome TaxID=652676 RepID=A0A1W1D1L4_9ZZZZ
MSNSFSPPRLTAQAPKFTTQSTVDIEINGKAGQHAYLDGVDIGILDTEGKLSIQLNLNEGVNTFSITLKDENDKESTPLVLIITKDSIAPLAPTLAVAIPAETDEGNITVNIQGEVAASIYLGAIKQGVIDASGTLSVVLNLTLGNNTFAFTQKDPTGNESPVLEISIIKNNTAPSFDLRKTSLSFVPRTYSYDTYQYHPSLVDMDKDGDLDIVSSYGDSSNSLNYIDGVVWKENDGSQNFTEHTVSSINNIDFIRNVYPIDIDNDGDIDILSEHETNRYTERTIVWSKNDGNQNFTDQNISLASKDIGSIQLIDMDKDGDIDFLSYRTDTNTTVWYQNDGSQNFTEHSIFVRDVRNHTLITSDLDGDGNMDIVSVVDLEKDEPIKWYKNDGNQNFSEHILISQIDYPRAIKIVDIDADGDLDLLIGSDEEIGIISWYENDGNQNFIGKGVYSGEFYSPEFIKVDAQDIDGDGDLDIISTFNDYGRDQMAWHENDGNQGFIAHSLNTSTRYNDKNIFVDIDGDGDLDYVYADSRDIIIQEQVLGYFTPENNATILTPLLATDIDNDTLTYSLSGEDASYFTIDSATGTLTLKAIPDFETPVNDNAYTVIVSVTDNTATINQEFTIVIENVADVLPTIRDKNITIVENMSSLRYRESLNQILVYDNDNIYIGYISMDRKDSSITSVRITGEGSNDFTITKEGRFLITAGVEIDYERIPVYTLSVYATNEAGESTIPATLIINVKDLTAPIVITTPLYTTESTFDFEIQGDIGDTLFVDGINTAHIFDETTVTRTLSKDSNNTVTIQANSASNEANSFTLFDSLNINLKDQNMSEFFISSEEHERSYSFTIDKEHNLSISMSSQAVYCYLAIYNEEGTRLYSSNDGFYHLVIAENLILSEGTYTIKAGVPWGGTGLFDLNITDNKIQ